MAFASWKDISIATGRSGVVYRLWDAVAHLLAGDMAGTWTIVQASSTGWTGDTSPEDGGWVVIQSESAWAGGSKLQIFVGARVTTGTLAGFVGTYGYGMWTCVSPDGGWDLVNHYFGSSSSDWRNAPLQWSTSYSGACVLNLVLTSGSTGRPGTLAVVTRSGSGTNAGTLAGALVPISPLTDAPYRVVHVTGIASFADAASCWGWSSYVRAKVPTVALDALNTAYVTGRCPERDQAGAYTEAAAWAVDTVTGRSVGTVDEIRLATAPNGDLSIVGDRHAWGGVSYPREAARDGSWV